MGGAGAAGTSLGPPRRLCHRSTPNVYVSCAGSAAGMLLNLQCKLPSCSGSGRVDSGCRHCTLEVHLGVHVPLAMGHGRRLPLQNHSRACPVNTSCSVRQRREGSSHENAVHGQSHSRCYLCSRQGKALQGNKGPIASQVGSCVCSTVLFSGNWAIADIRAARTNEQTALELKHYSPGA